MNNGPVTVIDARHRVVGFWREVWGYRELLYFLVWRDLKVRYKQTVFGVAWAIVQPLATMLAFSIVFGRLVAVPSDGVPYPVFSLAAVVPWTYFSSAITQGAASLVSSQHLIAKVYFPRLLVPLASVVTPIFDAAIALVMLGVLIVIYRVGNASGPLLMLPFFIALAVFAALAVSLSLAALNVRFRDVRYVLPFLIQFWLFVTPVAYSSSLIPEQWRMLYALNPMATVIDGFRWSLLGAPAPPASAVAMSVAIVVVATVGGLRYFQRAERMFADVI